jgi:hypothetical protein
MKSQIIGVCLGLMAGGVAAQSVSASVPYSPSWASRHHLQLLVDHADLALPLSHWPLPLQAVQEALDRLPQDLSSDSMDLASSRALVQRELQQRRDAARLTLQLRQRAEGVPGYDENYTPGSSVQLNSSEKRLQWGSISLAGRLGVRAEESSNALDNTGSGWGTEGRYQARLEDSAAVVGWGGWQLQAFSQRFWWGPGWQSSLVNSQNAPAWNGVGIQRSSAQQSSSPWLSWLGPWTFEVFMAKAQDPQTLAGQAQGFMFSGTKLTFKPWTWLEVGLSRGLQVGGAGRPEGLTTYAKALLGQEVNKWPWDTFEDSSGQIAGLELRARCPKSWGDCAVYTQGMGEDRRPYAPIPIAFMSLIGAEKAYDQGRQRVYVEWVNTNTCSYPIGDHCGSYPGYVNGVYRQGYTQGARWAGSVFGSGAEVTTVGWLDTDKRMRIQLHKGKTLSTVGSFDPSVAPTASALHGGFQGVSASRSVQWRPQITLTPEFSYMRFDEGREVGALANKQLRLGLTAQVAL